MARKAMSGDLDRALACVSAAAPIGMFALFPGEEPSPYDFATLGCLPSRGRLLGIADAAALISRPSFVFEVFALADILEEQSILDGQDIKDFYKWF